MFQFARRRGRHHYPETPASPVDLPPRFRPLLTYLEERAQGVRVDPEYAARMDALNAEYRAWAEQPRRP